VRRRLRADVPPLGADRHLHPDIAAATALVRDGVVIAEARVKLPGVSP
jgi:histidine ammonia-lyase